MITTIEVFDDNNQAQARIDELRNANFSNPRLLNASRVTLIDRRNSPGNPPKWSTGDGQGYSVVQYETQ